jgi:hypothetical protein
VECVPIDNTLLCSTVHISRRSLGWDLVWLCRGEKPRVCEEIKEPDPAAVRIIVIGRSTVSSPTLDIAFVLLDDVGTKCCCNIFRTPVFSFFGSVETALQRIVGSVTAQEYPLETTDASFHQDNSGT